MVRKMEVFALYRVSHYIAKCIFQMNEQICGMRPSETLLGLDITIQWTSHDDLTEKSPILKAIKKIREIRVQRRLLQ